MQNIELPQPPIRKAYYARQLWNYFLGIIEHKVTIGEEYKDMMEGMDTAKDMI